MNAAILSAHSATSAASRYTAELELGPVSGLSRRLNLHLLNGMLFVDINARKSGHLGSASAFMPACYLNLVGDDATPALHVGGAYFLVSRQQADRIRAIFEPHGLRIWETL